MEEQTVKRCKHRVDHDGRCYWLSDRFCDHPKGKSRECQYEAKLLSLKPETQAEQLERALKKVGY